MFLDRKFIYLFFFLIAKSLFAISYNVSFLGIDDSDIKKRVKNGSDLIQLRKKAPSSITALSYRVQSDIPGLIKILRAYGYYDAWVESDMEVNEDKVLVKLIFHTGVRYHLKSYEIKKAPCTDQGTFPCDLISLEDLNIELESPITSKEIINSELNILFNLSNCGYPLASVENRDLAVDMSQKGIFITECIDQGPLCHFGKLTIIGLKDVKPEYILRRVLFKEGQIYSSKLLEQTQKKFIDTELFSSAIITHAEDLDEQKKLPMKIHLTETKHRAFAVGISYATINGFGGTFSWVHRNLRGLGEKLRIEADISKIASVGNITYTKPDFIHMGQNYSATGAVIREDIDPYIAFTYRAANRLDRTFNERLYGSFGIKGEYISVVDSISNGHYTLIASPIYVKYSTANSLLNPTKGFSYIYKVTPYFSLNEDKIFFLKQRFTANFYYPIDKNKRFVFAFRAQLGSILGSSLSSIPFTKRFLGGSDDDLRGYRYKTVSPTNSAGKPTGGRSAIYWTFEPRVRITDNIGIVPFTDWGVVGDQSYPDPWNKWFKSAGIGLRYFTFFGPIRADIAFPLNKRSRDPRYRIYVSIGQTF